MLTVNKSRNRLFSETQAPLEARVFLAASVGPKSRTGASVGNQGTIDDRRAATSSYSSDRKTAKRGKFELFDITANGINTGDPRNTTADGLALANRVERRLPRLEFDDKDRFTFEGTFRIDDADSVYFAQLHADDRQSPGSSKSVGRGVHWLLRADENDEDSGKLDIYLERATKKAGRFSNGGRKNIHLRTIDKGQQFKLKVEGGSNLAGKKVFSNIYINGTKEFSGDQSFTTDFQALRYGAYGAPGGGNAKVLVKDVSYKS